MFAFWFKFHWNLYPSGSFVPHWCRKWLDAELAASHYLNWSWYIWLTHIHVALSLSELTYGSLARYVKMLVAHAPGMPGTFSTPPTSKETSNWRSRHASRHVRHARAVMHVGITNQWWRGSVLGIPGIPGIPGVCTTCNFAYLVRGPSWPGDMGSALLEVVPLGISSLSYFLT